ncbi:MAG TPA: type I-F CRISPR-associated endoribonuclease Cas6/Csy4 [Aeromonadales bacterium]|nr:type I-F CRISPR-associated endoribonuclease Cas6/Csy4 [Aeromonadales bacterium]
MKYYQDITLIPDAEVYLAFLWHKVYIQVHIGLADNKQPDGTSAIAVSFPEYVYTPNKANRFPLGKKLRLLAETEKQLQQFDTVTRLSRLEDYCHIRSIKAVPNVTKYCCFSRKQVKSAAKKAEILTEHLNKPLEEVIKFRKKNNLYQDCDLPFIHMESQQQTESGEKNKFRLFIQQTFCDSPFQVGFDCYGLSKTATVPWF